MLRLDAGPLVRIKQALTRLKQEVQQMDVRIGVVSLVVLSLRRNNISDNIHDKVILKTLVKN